MSPTIRAGAYTCKKSERNGESWKGDKNTNSNTKKKY